MNILVTIFVINIWVQISHQTPTSKDCTNGSGNRCEPIPRHQHQQELRKDAITQHNVQKDMFISESKINSEKQSVESSTDPTRRNQLSKIKPKSSLRKHPNYSDLYNHSLIGRDDRLKDKNRSNLSGKPVMLGLKLKKLWRVKLRPLKPPKPSKPPKPPKPPKSTTPRLSTKETTKEYYVEPEFKIRLKTDPPSDSDEYSLLKHKTLSKMKQGPIVILLTHKKRN